MGYHDLQVTKTQLADLLAYSPAGITRLVQVAALPPPGPRGTWILRDVLRAFGAHTKARRKELEGGAESSGETKSDSECRKLRAQADLAEIEVGKALGQLVEKDAIREEWGRILTALRARLLAIPTECARELGDADAVDCERILRDAIHAVLADVAGGVAEPPG